MVQGRCQLEIAEATVGRCSVHESDQGLACGNGILEELWAAGVPHHVAQCARVAAVQRRYAFLDHEGLKISLY